MSHSAAGLVSPSRYAADALCTGTGRTDCTYDDLGCDCGLCDGYGYCVECSGQGWFNEAGEPCWVGAEEWGRDASCGQAVEA